MADLDNGRKISYLGMRETHAGSVGAIQGHHKWTGYDPGGLRARPTPSM